MNTTLPAINEVMNWFCDGAEFEDILVALQTEELSDTPAEEMLVMLAEGFTWEEIWLVVGLIERSRLGIGDLK